MGAEPTWTLRPATQADATAIAELRAVVMRPSLEALGRYDEHRVRNRFLEGYRPERTQVIEVDGVFAGSIAVRLEGDAVWIEHFYLASHTQGRGIGGAVLRRVMREEARQGLPFRLDVLKGSAARRLYERHGFRFERALEWDDILSAAPRES
ncbi:GNAT family N-acetyltransferase [Rathayibacter tanaceti]|uniref:Acetyltransferase (GNAT) family protein n=2 Tax=Rathayibacter tanaceti TaxID=1671680 RepID=A0ACD2XLK6_9MICO|nr:GNAT family N-acetyltransferase [Rathayibacter tanaceti]KZX22566.1 Acetyltransferase (GNAT) family protein [Rathayibacter tanaceti]TCO37423.1 acetyltransferase (GNAT) family protein [Rathayibacter tanaceti]